MGARDAKAVLCPVAPLAGAWIEIKETAVHIAESLLSLPSRERGLKFRASYLENMQFRVAPLAGAWIEIASLAGSSIVPLPSLPSRERGLKSLRPDYHPNGVRRSPRGSVD